MTRLPPNPYIESRGSGYFLAGTRISLDSVACAVGRGENVDEIAADFPVIESRLTLAAVVAFIKAHPKEIEAYLAEMATRWEDARRLNASDVVERARKYRHERTLESA